MEAPVSSINIKGHLENELRLDAQLLGRQIQMREILLLVIITSSSQLQVCHI